MNYVVPGGEFSPIYLCGVGRGVYENKMEVAIMTFIRFL